MIQALRRHAPQEKLVVVSSFTSSLDRIEALAASMGLSSTAVLRLDGKVPVALRQPLVDLFNRPGDDSFMFLLSAKAGGVGINL
jgi:DNA repair and recombination protein RAD54B